MPTLIFKVYCDDEPNNLEALEAKTQKALQAIDEQFVVAKTEYSEDESEIVDILFPGCVLTAPLELVKP